MAVSVEDRPRTRRRAVGAAAGPASAAGAGAVAAGTPPRLRRRPLLVVVSVALVCLGALVAAWAFTAVSSAQPVVAVRDGIGRGEVIGRADLVVVRVGVDPALRPVPADQLDVVVGRRAATDVAAGGLLTADAVTDQLLPRVGWSVVGVAVPPSSLPGEPLRPGGCGAGGRHARRPDGCRRRARGDGAPVAATVVSVHAG